MKWKVMDALDMGYKDETFDVVIDKSKIGTNLGLMVREGVLGARDVFFIAF